MDEAVLLRRSICHSSICARNAVKVQGSAALQRCLIKRLRRRDAPSSIALGRCTKYEVYRKCNACSVFPEISASGMRWNHATAIPLNPLNAYYTTRAQCMRLCCLNQRSAVRGRSLPSFRFLPRCCRQMELMHYWIIGWPRG
jgi:hypothetical protein